MLALLRERRESGIEVTVLSRQAVGGYKPHGKLMIIDDSRAVLGSMALSALSLDFRREVSIVIDDGPLVSELGTYLDELIARVGDVGALPGDRAR